MDKTDFPVNTHGFKVVSVNSISGFMSRILEKSVLTVLDFYDLLDRPVARATEGRGL